MSAKEEIENLKVWIEGEKDAIEHFTRKIDYFSEYREYARKKLARYEERLAAELSQVSA